MSGSPLKVMIAPIGPSSREESVTTESNKEKSIPGVCGIAAKGNVQRVHLYQGGDYGLEDIAEFFELGHVEPTEIEAHTVIILWEHHCIGLTRAG